MRNNFTGMSDEATSIGRRMADLLIRRINEFLRTLGGKSCFGLIDEMVHGIHEGARILTDSGFDEFHDRMLEVWGKKCLETVSFSHSENGIPGLYGNSAPKCLSREASLAWNFLRASGVSFGKDGNFMKKSWYEPLEYISLLFDLPSPDASEEDERHSMSGIMTEKRGIRESIMAYIDEVVAQDGFLMHPAELRCMDAIRKVAGKMDDDTFAILLANADHGRRLLGYRFIPDSNPDGDGDIALLEHVLLTPGNPSYLLPSENPMIDPDLTSFARLMRHNGCFRTAMDGSMALNWLIAWDNIIVYLMETRGMPPCPMWPDGIPFSPCHWDDVFSE